MCVFCPGWALHSLQPRVICGAEGNYYYGVCVVCVYMCVCMCVHVCVLCVYVCVVCVCVCVCMCVFVIRSLFEKSLDYLT